MTTLRYLGRPLDQMDDDFLDVRRKIMRARSVWGMLGTLLQLEGADPRVEEMFYRAVVQVILLYGLESWVLLVATKRKAEGMNTRFLREITGNRVLRLVKGTWETPRAEGVREAEGMQTDMTYIRRWQETVAQWVALHPLFEVFARDKGYEGGGLRRESWWLQVVI